MWAANKCRCINLHLSIDHQLLNDKSFIRCLTSIIRKSQNKQAKKKKNPNAKTTKKNIDFEMNSAIAYEWHHAVSSEFKYA